MTMFPAGVNKAQLDVLQKKMLVGQYILPVPLATYFPNSFNLVADRLEANVLFLAKSTPVDRIAVWVGTVGAGGTTARLGIYRDNGSMYPGALLFDEGVVPVDGANEQSINISRTLAKGTYWTVIISDGTPRIGGGDPGFAPGWLQNSSWDRGQGRYVRAGAFGVLPNPFPAGGTLTSYMLLVLLRKA